MQFLPYHSQIISERVNIQAVHLTRDIDRHIEERAKRKLERKNCCYGYVGHIHILSRSVGFYDSPHFNGEMTFQIEAVSDVCRPASGDEFLAIIVNVNKMGFLAKAGDHDELHIYCARTHGGNAAFFEDPRMRPQTHVTVRVSGCKFSLNDVKMVVVGNIVKLHDSDELDDYRHKLVAIARPTTEVQVGLKFRTGAQPGESRAKYGNESHVQSVKRLLGTTMEGLEATGSKGECARLYSDARSLANEFELVCPPHAYYSGPPVVTYRPLNRAFFKLWEILNDFPGLLPKRGERDNVVTVHLAESPGSFVEATKRFREGLHPSVADRDVRDVMFAMSLRASTDASPNVPPGDALVSNMTGFPNVMCVRGGESRGATPRGFTMRQGDGSGDLFVLGNILDLAADVQARGGADFATGDLGFEFSAVEDSREACMSFAIFAQMVGILLAQKQGGSCVIKCFDCFTRLTTKLIVYMSQFYRESHITKPYSSRSGNPEKYLVFQGFTGLTDEQRDVVRATFSEWRELEPWIGGQYEKNTQFVTDLPNIEVPDDVADSIAEFNRTNVSSRQVRALNKMIRFLKKPLDAEDRAAAVEEQLRNARAWQVTYMSPWEHKSS